MKCWLWVAFAFAGCVSVDGSSAAINREALVNRHQPVLREFDRNNPFTVGNGTFAFTADATGLQTFDQEFTNTIPLGTLSDWGWHTFPNPNGWNLANFNFKEFDVFGRKVGYADVPRNQFTDEIKWLRSNPHRLHLGQIGFVLTKADGSPAAPSDLTDFEQRLDMWNGALHSRFKFQGRSVEVETICHPDDDMLAVRVVSPLLKQGRLGIRIRFPYGTGATTTADWAHPDAHETKLGKIGTDAALFSRKLDADTYEVAAQWSGGAELRQVAKHEFILQPNDDSGTIELVCAFEPKRIPTIAPKRLPGKLLNFAQTRKLSKAHWNQFWKSGAAIDLSGSKDPRWRELERRIVLSQYLTAIQCSGHLPPQETGLTYNTWEGKFHLEMHWWHAAHFALWNRLSLLENSLGYYDAILSRAQGTARRQGYEGARWPKMTSLTGVESPSPVGPFLVWQQPHPIFYAELCYRAHPDRATLLRFTNVVAQTAEFMASYPEWDTNGNRFVLGPALQCAQEIFPKSGTLNPTFELTYWRWGLETAQQWRQRLGLPRDTKWDRVLRALAKPPVEQEKYLFAETATGTYTEHKWTDDHPSVTAAFGMLPGPEIDRETMRRTLDWIWNNWNWPDTWGWDYGMLAMCAARLGEPERAIDALLLDTPKNHYAINGHNYQRPGLTLYLPGNGSLLYAVGVMAGGWDGAPAKLAPGFPDNGQWTVRCENFRRAP